MAGTILYFSEIIIITFTVNLNIFMKIIASSLLRVCWYASSMIVNTIANINMMLIRYVVPDTPGQQHSLLAGLDVNPLEGWDPAKVGDNYGINADTETDADAKGGHHREKVTKLWTFSVRP